MAGAIKSGAHGALAGSSAGRLTAGDEAMRVALATLAFGEAPRVGVLGDSGTGKTHAMRQLVAGYLRASPGIALVVDDKEPRPQFAGQERRDRDELAARPPDPNGPRAIVFRGDRFAADGDVDPETIAELQWQLAQRGRASVVVYDELDKGAANGQWKAGKRSRIAWCFGKGRSVGAASIWGTQETQAVPREAFNQSSAILCFKMIGAPLRLLGDRGYLEGGAGEIIPALPGEPLPPPQRGEFVLLRRGQPWDQHIYKFGPERT